MNIRVISFVLLIILFVLASAMLNLSISGGNSLSEAYNQANIKVTQKTPAGIIPSEIEIINNGNSSINVKKGIVLSSSITQDMVIAEDKQIGTNSKGTVKAYGIEPTQRSVPETKFLPVNNTYSAVNEIISNSNPYNSQIAYQDQLKIWIIMSANNFNPYTGEPVAVVENKGITWTQFRQDIQLAKNDIIKTFNVNEDEIKNLNQKESNNQNWINNTINSLKSILKIQ